MITIPIDVDDNGESRSDLFYVWTAERTTWNSRDKHLKKDG
jgi:hypothetical protein